MNFFVAVFCSLLRLFLFMFFLSPVIWLGAVGVGAKKLLMFFPCIDGVGDASRLVQKHEASMGGVMEGQWTSQSTTHGCQPDINSGNEMNIHS